MYPLLTNINSQFIDDCGKPLAGGKVYTYEANTTTPKPTYADVEGLAVNTNPIILDESGRANIHLDTGAYRIRVLNKKGALIADTPEISRYVMGTELDEFIQTIQDGVNELNQVKETLETVAETVVSNQKGVVGGLAPLDDETALVDPIYLPIEDSLESNDAKKILSAKMGKKLNDEKLDKSDIAEGEAPIFAARAWVNFNGGTGEIRKSGNIATVVRNGSGSYSVAFTKPMPHADYVVVTGLSYFGAGTNFGVTSQSANGFTLQATYGGDNTTGSFDPLIATVTIFC